MQEYPMHHHQPAQWGLRVSVHNGLEATMLPTADFHQLASGSQHKDELATAGHGGNGAAWKRSRAVGRGEEERMRDGKRRGGGRREEGRRGKREGEEGRREKGGGEKGREESSDGIS